MPEPDSSPIPFDNTYVNLPEKFYVKQTPAHVPDPQLIRINQKLASQLGIDLEWLASPDGVAVLSGNLIPLGAYPLAQAYAGHQFGGFSPQLGDGRAILLGEVIDRDHIRKDIQLKGSGKTPFSRGGDGKSALGPVLREYIVSEAMAALGVPTTRALAAVTTGESVLRQEGSIPGGVFTRVASSHVRVGTFQYFASRGDTEAVKILADYVIDRHYPECAKGDYVELLTKVMQAQARLIAKWMSLGFIHGVMNTDNTAISGETIDYGPCAFMDIFHPHCVFSSIDQQARYAWGNQAQIALWNITRFAETLIPIIHQNKEKAIELAQEKLSEYSDYFNEQYQSHFRKKFGLTDSTNDQLIQTGLSLLANQQIDFTIFFRLLTRAANDKDGNDTAALKAMFPDQAEYMKWHQTWQNAINPEESQQLMQSANPIIIPRNHRVEQAIQAAYKGDFQPFHRLTEALQNPYTVQEQYRDLEKPPTPEQVVRETFCGT